MVYILYVLSENKHSLGIAFEVSTQVVLVDSRDTPFEAVWGLFSSFITD